MWIVAIQKSSDQRSSMHCSSEASDSHTRSLVRSIPLNPPRIRILPVLLEPNLHDAACKIHRFWHAAHRDSHDVWLCPAGTTKQPFQGPMQRFPFRKKQVAPNIRFSVIPLRAPIAERMRSTNCSSLRTTLPISWPRTVSYSIRRTTRKAAVHYSIIGIGSAVAKDRHTLVPSEEQGQRDMHLDWNGSHMLRSCRVIRRTRGSFIHRLVVVTSHFSS